MNKIETLKLDLNDAVWLYEFNRRLQKSEPIPLDYLDQRANELCRDISRLKRELKAAINSFI
jgi:hypothetical protein